MKVLISDDEVKVCKLIQHLIDWESMGFEIIDIVNDGKAAFESICANTPDIVITDIKMPYYDGIELIRRSREKSFNIYFIIISGYSEFEYAQSALRYGVEDYLLKPLKKKELQDTLNKIKQRHTFHISESIEKEELKSIAGTSKENLKQDFLRKLVKLSEKEEWDDISEIEEINKQYQCHFKNGYFISLKIRPFLMNKAIDYKSLEFLLAKLQQLTKEKLEPDCTEFICISTDEEVICLLNTTLDDLNEIEKNLKSLKPAISNLKEIFVDINIVIGMGRTYHSIGGAISSLKEAETALLYRIADPSRYVIKYSDPQQSKKKTSDFIGISKRNEIIACQERIDLNSLLEHINSLKKQIEPYKSDAVLVYSCFCELVEILKFGIKNYGEPFNAYFLFDDQKKFKNLLTYDEIFEWIKSEINKCYISYIESKKMADSKPILIAKQYIYDHYNQNLRLEDISAYIGFNPAYFSSLFKKKTGKNFSEYVADLRIQNAKIYLIQTQQEIADIAVAVGYSDLKYFSKLFKKLTGLNPNEYRKLYGR